MPKSIPMLDSLSADMTVDDFIYVVQAAAGPARDKKMTVGDLLDQLISSKTQAKLGDLAWDVADPYLKVPGRNAAANGWVDLITIYSANKWDTEVWDLSTDTTKAVDLSLVTGNVSLLVIGDTTAASTLTFSNTMPEDHIYEIVIQSNSLTHVSAIMHGAALLSSVRGGERFILRYKGGVRGFGMTGRPLLSKLEDTTWITGPILENFIEGFFLKPADVGDGTITGRDAWNLLAILSGGGGGVQAVRESGALWLRRRQVAVPVTVWGQTSGSSIAYKVFPTTAVVQQTLVLGASPVDVVPYGAYSVTAEYALRSNVWPAAQPLSNWSNPQLGSAGLNAARNAVFVKLDACMSELKFRFTATSGGDTGLTPTLGITLPEEYFDITLGVSIDVSNLQSSGLTSADFSLCELIVEDPHTSPSNRWWRFTIDPAYLFSGITDASHAPKFFLRLQRSYDGTTRVGGFTNSYDREVQ